MGAVDRLTRDALLQQCAPTLVEQVHYRPGGRGWQRLAVELGQEPQRLFEHLYRYAAALHHGRQPAHVIGEEHRGTCSQRRTEEFDEIGDILLGLLTPSHAAEGQDLRMTSIEGIGHPAHRRLGPIADLQTVLGQLAESPAHGRVARHGLPPLCPARN